MIYKVYTPEGFKYGTAWGTFTDPDRANEAALDLREDLGIDAFVLTEEA